MRVGVLDSGVGGLSVLRAVRAQAPELDLVYFADQANLPYGPRSAEEICALSATATEQLLAARCEAIVVACNTASAAALESLRKQHPQIPFVGMEPAIKPAAAITRNGVIGVLATPGTLRGDLFRRSRASHAAEHRVIEQPCEGWVEQVEAGVLNDAAAHDLVARDLQPLLAAGADVLVLGCTHFPFLESMISSCAGPAVHLIDPAPAVAAQLLRVIGPQRSGSGALFGVSSKCLETLQQQCVALLGLELQPLS